MQTKRIQFCYRAFQVEGSKLESETTFSYDQTRLTRLPAMAEGASSSYCVRKYILTFKNLQVASYFEQLSHHNNVFSLKHPIFEGETNKFVNAFAGLSQ